MYLLIAALLATPIHFSKNPNYCLDVSNGTAANNQKVQLYKCNGTAAQDFTLGDTPTVVTVPSNPGVSSPASTLVDPGTPVKNGYHLVFSDEFDGSTLDLKKWNLMTDGSGGGNWELQYYVAMPDNHFLSDSKLTIRTLKKSYLGQQYTSAKLTTQGAFATTYGWIEARIKVPKGQGLWPAFWMMPKDSLYGQWPTSGEIDIMEILSGAPNQLYGTAHYGPAWPNQKQLGGQKNLSGVDFSQDFHVFAVNWTADHIDWYVDGELYFTMKDTDGDWQTASQGAPESTSPGKWPFDKPFYLILNQAMGGNWPGAPDPSITQGDLIIDYVRVYQAN